MDQEKNNEKFSEFNHRRARFHRHHEERYAPHHMHATHRSKSRLDDQKVEDCGKMRMRRESGIRRFYIRSTGRGGALGRRFHRADHLNRGLNRQAQHRYQRWHGEEKTMLLMYEKQRLENRIERARRRLNFVNRQLHTQIG